MTAQERPYVRVYYSIVDDPRFERIWPDNDALATWLRLLIVADAMYPAMAPIPRLAEEPMLVLLEECGLIERRANMFRIHGLENERNGRQRRGQAGGLARASGIRNQAGQFASSETSGDTSLAQQYPAESQRDGASGDASIHQPNSLAFSLDDQRTSAPLLSEPNRTYRLGVTLPTRAREGWTAAQLAAIEADKGRPVAMRMTDEERAAELDVLKRRWTAKYGTVPSAEVVEQLAAEAQMASTAVGPLFEEPKP